MQNIPRPKIGEVKLCSHLRREPPLPKQHWSCALDLFPPIMRALPLHPSPVSLEFLWEVFILKWLNCIESFTSPVYHVDLFFPLASVSRFWGTVSFCPPCSPWAVFHIWFLIRSSAIAVQRCTDIDKSANPLANPGETPFASFRGRLNTESQTRASDIFIAVLWVTMSSVVLGVQALESYVVVIFGKG